MIFVLSMLFTFVYDRKNENHWSLLIIRYSLLITRNTNTRQTLTIFIRVLRLNFTIAFFTCLYLQKGLNLFIRGWLHGEFSARPEFQPVYHFTISLHGTFSPGRVKYSSIYKPGWNLSREETIKSEMVLYFALFHHVRKSLLDCMRLGIPV